MFSPFKVCHFKSKTSMKKQPVVIELDATEVGSNVNHHFDAYYEE
jgi:hypothetical protein